MSLPVEIYIKILSYTVDNISLKTYNMVYNCVGDIIDNNSSLRNNMNELTKALEMDDEEKAKKILVKYPEYKDIFEYEKDYYINIITKCDNIDFIVTLHYILLKKYNYIYNYNDLCKIIFDKIEDYYKELFTKLNNF